MSDNKISILIEMRQAIRQLTARMDGAEARQDALEEWILPTENVAVDPVPLTIDVEPAVPHPDPEMQMVRDIEDHIIAKISGWKWSEPYRGGLACPLSASNLGGRGKRWDTNRLRMLIADKSLWQRVRWVHMPLPDGHPDGHRTEKAQTVVVSQEVLGRRNEA